MEGQQVFVCSSDVAAFVDALETIGYPVVGTQGNGLEEADDRTATLLQVQEAESFTIEPDIVQVPVKPPKRYRTNPKMEKLVIERLFEKQKAVVTEKAFMNIKGNKRFRSNVWSWFGDVKLLISRSEAKTLNIPYYFRQCGDEQMMLSKCFVACFKCSSLFFHNTRRSGTSTLRAHIRTCSRPRPKKKKGTPTIIFFPNKASDKHVTRLVSQDDKMGAQEKLLEFILGTESNFDIIEEPELHKLLQMCLHIGSNYGDVNVESMLCPQEKLTDFLLNDLYVASLNAFYTEFQYSYGASYATNIWIDEQQKSTYASIICHYSTSNGEMKSVIMHTDEFNCETKAPEDMNDWFTLLMTESAIVPFKKLMVIDNISNVAQAFKDEENIKCIYQSINLALQLVVKKALATSQNEHPDFVSLLFGCRDLVAHFEQASIQYQLPEPLKTYKEDSWSSIIAMFRSVCTQYENILNILNETGETALMSVDKSVLSSVIDLFQIFEEAQVEFSDSVKPTLNIVIPWITKIKKRCNMGEHDFPFMRQLKKWIGDEVKEHMIKNVTIYHRVATLLDPRFKQLAFMPRDDQIATHVKAKCLVKECMEIPIMEDNSDVKHQNDLVNKDRFSDLYSSNVSYEAGNSEKSAHREVDNYLAETFSLANQNSEQQAKFNPLRYWTQNLEKYPNLGRVAMWVLSCPASCIQTEESFWNNNWLVNCCRLHQKPEHVNKLLFIKSYKNV